MEAKAAVAEFGLPREIDPSTALLEELHRTAGHVAWLEAEVAKLPRDEISGPVGGGQYSFPNYEPNVLIRMAVVERKHLVEVARVCKQVGIEERQVQIAEQTGLMLAEMRRILTEVRDSSGPPVLEMPGVAEVVRRHLTAAAEAEAANP